MTLPALLLLVMVVTALIVVGATWRPTGLPQHADRGLRHDRLVQAIALAVAGLTALMGALWALESPLVHGELAIPLAGVLGAGIGYLAVVAVGQWVWPRPAGPRRRALLTPRGIGDVAGGWAPRLVGVSLGVAVLAVLLPALLAPLDGPSAGTRQVFRAGWDEPPSAVITLREVAGLPWPLREFFGLPWPGLRYGLPALLAIGVLLALAALALRAVADRATVTDAGSAWDQQARATVVRRIVTATAGVLAMVGGLFMLTAGSRLMETQAGLPVLGGGLLLAVGTLWASAGAGLAVLGVLWPGWTAKHTAAAGSRP
ncbi:MAG: hypothetical protein JWQ26_411 [Modestobacter sp.]|nr:hypothetical protein [Modestobacter sp.]